MDSTHLTKVRKGLAGALAADVLACKEADTVAVIGSGVQGRCQLRSFAALRRIHKGSVYDAVPERAETFARELSSELGLAVEAAEAVREAGVVFTATWARFGCDCGGVGRGARRVASWPGLVRAGDGLRRCRAGVPGPCRSLGNLSGCPASWCRPGIDFIACDRLTSRKTHRADQLTVATPPPEKPRAATRGDTYLGSQVLAEARARVPPGFTDTALGSTTGRQGAS